MTERAATEQWEALGAVNRAIKELQKQKGRQHAVKLLADFCVLRTTELKADQYAAVIEGAQRLLKGEA